MCFWMLFGCQWIDSSTPRKCSFFKFTKNCDRNFEKKNYPPLSGFHEFESLHIYCAAGDEFGSTSGSSEIKGNSGNFIKKFHKLKS